MDWHIDRFGCIADQLHLYTEKVTISFIGLYRKISSAVKRENIRELSSAQKDSITKAFSQSVHACQNGCVCCYASHNTDTRIRNFQRYDPADPLLYSQILELDRLTDRKMKIL